MACIAATLTNTAKQYHQSQNGKKKKLQNQTDTKGGLISESFTLLQPKGQLITKCLFGVFNFLQKTNENKSHSSKIEFVRSLFGGNVGLKK